MSRGGLSSTELQSAQDILEKLRKHPASTDFLEPVNYVELNLPDYPTVINEPMDLGTVQEKLDADTYRSLRDVMSDLSLIWSNCKTYNESGSQIVKRAEKLERIARKWFSSLDTQEVTFEEKVDLAEQIRRADMKELERIVDFVRISRPKSIRMLSDGRELVSLEGIDRTLYRRLCELANSGEKSS